MFLQLGQWSTFGTLEVTAQTESETKVFSVVAEEDCEILIIPAKNYAKLKSVWLYLIYVLTQYGYKLTLSFASLGRRCPYLFYILICLELETIKIWYIWWISLKPLMSSWSGKVSMDKICYMFECIWFSMNLKFICSFTHSLIHSFNNYMFWVSTACHVWGIPEWSEISKPLQSTLGRTNTWALSEHYFIYITYIETESCMSRWSQLNSEPLILLH